MTSLWLDRALERLWPPVQLWVHYPDSEGKRAKADLLDAYDSLGPREKAAYDADVAAAFFQAHKSDHVIAYRRRKASFEPMAGLSMSTLEPGGRSDAYSVSVGDVLVHWGQAEMPLSSRAYGHEKEIILRRDAEPVLFESNPTDSKLYFGGDDAGNWTSSERYRDISGSRWQVMPMHGGYYSVEGATEWHLGFRKALVEIARETPYILDMQIVFDGPRLDIRELVETTPSRVPWEKITFLHGTSSVAYDRIRKEGLVPRSVSGVSAAYGARSSAKEGSKDLVYLTTQSGTAHFAAKDAVNAAGGGIPVVLAITGIKKRYAMPDVDSGEGSAEMSLASLGAIGYSQRIPPDSIHLLESYADRKWTPAMKANPTGSKIVEILSVIDTREYEEVADGVFKPIAGSGNENECGRCGRMHEVHAHVRLESGETAVVGTGCMRGESVEVTKAVTKAANAAKRLGRLKAEYKKLTEELAAWDEAWAKVLTLTPPEPVRKQHRHQKDQTVVEIGDACLWLKDLHGREPGVRDMEMLVSLWRQHQMSGYIHRNRYSIEAELKEVEKRIRKLIPPPHL